MSGLTEFGECIYKLTEMKQERDQYKAENEKLKEEVEHLKGIIQDEEDWKLLELEHKELENEEYQ